MRDNAKGINGCKISTAFTQSVIHNFVQNCMFLKAVLTKEYNSVPFHRSHGVMNKKTKIYNLPL